MAYVPIVYHLALKVAHNLVHIDEDMPLIVGVKGNRFDLRIDLGPLPGPVFPDGFLPFDKTSFKCFGPSHIQGHSGKSGVNVTGVEGSVRGA